MLEVNVYCEERVSIGIKLLEEGGCYYDLGMLVIEAPIELVHLKIMHSLCLLITHLQKGRILRVTVHDMKYLSSTLYMTNQMTSEVVKALYNTRKILLQLSKKGKGA
uniref:Uncharacterized protein n=1 Tax=Arundo donax TaxID=35708 RepID=A0A0A9G1S8_ARUDO